MELITTKHMVYEGYCYSLIIFSNLDSFERGEKACMEFRELAAETEVLQILKL
jgi:hypothetical protein